MVEIAEIDKMLGEMDKEERNKMYNVGLELVSYYAKVLREEKTLSPTAWMVWQLSNYLVWKLRE